MARGMPSPASQFLNIFVNWREDVNWRKILALVTPLARSSPLAPKPRRREHAYLTVLRWMPRVLRRSACSLMKPPAGWKEGEGGSGREG